MKILLKKLTIMLLMLNFIIFPLTACFQQNNNGGGSKEIENVTFENTEFAYNGQEQSLLVTGDLPEGVTATYENNTHKEFGMYNAVCTLSGNGYKTKTLNAVMTIKYDDKGEFDKENYQYKTQTKFDDTEILSENHKKGKFNGGQTEILLLNQADIENDNKIKAGIPVVNSSGALKSVDYNIAKSDADVYYKTVQQAQSENNIKPPQNSSNSGYLVLESKKAGNTNVAFSFTPSCTLQQFAEADYIEFDMYLTSQSGNEKETYVTLYVGNSSLFASLVVNTWVKVRVPLNIYLSARYTEMSNVKSKEDLYNYLKAGKPFFWTSTTFKGDGKQVYSVYFSDLKLKVDTPNEGVTASSFKWNDFAYLGKVQTFTEKGKEALENIFPRYLDNGLTTDNYAQFLKFGPFSNKLIRIDTPINSDNQKSKQTLINNMYLQVKPTKTYDQIAQYDALAVTMYVETQNPHPLIVLKGVPGPSSKVEYEVAKFSANKWITFEIPIEDVLAMYQLMVNNGHYTTTNAIKSNIPQELFSLTYEANVSDWKNGKFYAKDLYSKRVEESDGSVSTKWTEYPSRMETHAPMVQGTWVQYPYTLYIESLKLVKH